MRRRASLTDVAVKISRSIARTAALLAFFAACGSPPEVVAPIQIPTQPPQVPGRARPNDDPPPGKRPPPAPIASDCSGAPRFADRCVPIAGSKWALTTHMPEGTRLFHIDFNDQGRLRSHDPVDNTTDNDEWDVIEGDLRFWFNERYVVHEAIFTSDDEMHGNAINVNDMRWTWSARRLR